MSYSSNLSRYEIFLAAAECGSVSGAAKKLYISQPAVSAAVKKLEENLGCSLFIRRPRGIELTESGRILYSGISHALASITEAEAELSDCVETNRLRIAASSVLCKFILMPSLKRFIEKNPKTDVSIVCVSSAQSEMLLRDQKIDIALMAKPENISGLVYIPAGKIEYAFVCTPAYLEKFKGRNIIESGNVMLLNKKNGSRVHIDKYYSRNNIVSQHILEVNDMDLLIEFAKIGIGVSCVVRQFVEKELRAGELIEINLKNPIPDRETGFLYNSDVLPVNDNIIKLINETGCGSICIH